MKSSFTQTQLSTVTNVGIQTNQQSTMARSTSGGVMEALLIKPPAHTDAVLDFVGDDPVVEYDNDGDDTPRSEVTVVQQVRFGQRPISLPHLTSPMLLPSSPSPARSPARGSVPPQVVLVPARVDIEEANRTVARLKRELEEVKTSGTLRERELNSIVDNCRQAIRSEVLRETNKREEDLKKEIESQERANGQLKEIIVKKDETIRGMKSQLQLQEELIGEAKRERDRQWKIIEGDLHSEIARLRKEKERMRFDSEVVHHRIDTASTALSTLQSRASDAEQRWYADQERTLTMQEAECRLNISQHWQDVFEALTAGATHVQRLDDYHTIRGDTRWQRIYDLLDVALDYNGDAGYQRYQAAVAASPLEDDPLLAKDITMAAAEQLIHDMLAKRAAAWHEYQSAAARDAQTRDALLDDLGLKIQSWEVQLAELDTQTASRVANMSQQCTSMDRILGICASKVAAQGSQRASSKANHEVLESLVENHEREMLSITARCKELQCELEEVRRCNMTDEARALQIKNNELEKQYSALKRESTELKGRLRALEEACRDMESGASENVVRLQRSASEVEELRHQVRESEQAHRLAIGKLNVRITELEKENKLLHNQAEEAKDSIELQQKRYQALETRSNALKEKFVSDRTDEVVARVNRRLSMEAVPSKRSFDEAEVEQLQQKLLLLRRENDSLANRLDSALAEASHAQEQRRHALEKNLALMSAEDAAPRREQVLMAFKAELDTLAKSLEEKEKKLETRAVEIERREAAAAKQQSLTSKGTGLLSRVATPSAELHSTHLSAAETPLEAALRGTPENGSRPGSTLRLAPITQRPAVFTNPSSALHHPQRFS